MATRPTRRWPASLHGGQLVILMLAISLLGYAVMSGAAAYLWHAQNAAFKGYKPPREYWLVFFGGVAIVLAGHLMGRAWSAARKVSAILSLLLALWLPGLLGLWAYRSFSQAQHDSIEYASMPPDATLDTIPPGRMAMEISYKNVAGEYALLMLGCGLLAVVMLFVWFGGRRAKGLPPSPLRPTAEKHDAL